MLNKATLIKNLQHSDQLVRMYAVLLLQDQEILKEIVKSHEMEK